MLRVLMLRMHSLSPVQTWQIVTANCVVFPSFLWAFVEGLFDGLSTQLAARLSDTLKDIEQLNLSVLQHMVGLHLFAWPQ